MANTALLEDTTLAALISSKICHDLAGQIGAINNGLELLEEESDDDTRFYALELIQNSAKLAWAQLDFHRLAFGASSGLTGMVPLGQIEQIARRYVENGKRRLHWQTNTEEISKTQAKLLLAILAVSLSTLPAGGDFYVGLSANSGVANFKLLILCRGRLARIPDRIAEIMAGADIQGIDSRLILPYYAGRLASEANLCVGISKDGDDVVFSVQPIGAKPS